MSEQLSLAAVDPLADVVAWAREYPDAWQYVVEWAHQDHAAGIPISTRAYACVLRRPHMVARLGLQRRPFSPVTVNDHITAGLARLLNREYPHLDVPTRRAWADGGGSACLPVS